MKAQSCLFKPLMPHLSGRKIETDADIHNEEHCWAQGVYNPNALCD
jgi:hypothetical protein